MQSSRRSLSVDVSAVAGRVVLVVDDNMINRRVLEDLLCQEGYAVRCAVDGAEAIAIFESEPVDFVLMDVMMPGVDGYAATRHIKRFCAERDRYCPVLFVTALSDERSLADCIDCGGDGFLVKPYNRTLLKAKMRALERSRDLYALVQQQRDELAVHHEHLRHEHDIAERTFSKLMQACFLDAPNLRHMLAPVGLASGDLLLAEYRPDGVQHILLGDFTGHGLAAAMGAIPVADIFQSMTRKGLDIDLIAAEINRKLRAKLPVGLFLAACLLAVDAATGKVCIWNGGVPDVLVHRAGAGLRARLPSRHLPLGILDATAFVASLDCADLQAGDRIYAFSDGLPEAIAPDGGMFGEARLSALIEDPAATDPFAAICSALAGFRQGHPQHDDITLIEIVCPLASAPRRALPPARDASDSLAISVEYGAARLRHDDARNLLSALLEALPVIAARRSQVYTLIAELFNNALDHGLLGMDSRIKDTADGFAAYYRQRDERLRELRNGTIRISLRLSGTEQQGEVCIEVEDSGAGFDHAVMQAPPAAGCLSRRGLALVRSLCRSVDFHGSGNRVTAVHAWPDTVTEA